MRQRLLMRLAMLMIFALANTGAETGNGRAQVRVLVRAASGAELSTTKLVAHLDSRPIAVEAITQARDEPLTFAILLDISASMTDKRRFEKESALKLFRTLAIGQNVGFFGDFNDELYLSHKPATLDSVSRELKEIGEFRGGTSLRDSVLEAAKLVSRSAKNTNNRRAVIVFSDGGDEASKFNPKQAVSALQFEGVPVFCIGLLGEPGSRQKSISELQGLSEPTGGSTIFLTEPHDFIPSLLQQLDAQYWLTLALPVEDQRRLHLLSLQSDDPSVKLYAPSAIPLD